MSDIKPNGGPAFPIPHAIADANDPAFKRGNGGMSLRDYFAGQADPFSGDLNDALIQAVAGCPEPDWITQPLVYMQWLAEATAKWKLMQADAMIAARNS